MKTSSRIAFVLAVALAFIWLTSNSSPSNAQGAPRLALWEYKTLERGSIEDRELNDLGKERWELVTIYKHSDSAMRAVLKREALAKR